MNVFSPTALSVGVGVFVAHLASIAYEATQTPPFMEVTQLEYQGGDILYSRTINEPSTWATWSTVVVADGHGEAICQGSGESEYEVSEKLFQPMAFDMFVGVPWCHETLVPGQSYTLYVYWIPNDGRETVSGRIDFVKS